MIVTSQPTTLPALWSCWQIHPATKKSKHVQTMCVCFWCASYFIDVVWHLFITVFRNLLNGYHQLDFFSFTYRSVELYDLELTSVWLHVYWSCLKLKYVCCMSEICCEKDDNLMHVSGFSWVVSVAIVVLVSSFPEGHAYMTVGPTFLTGKRGGKTCSQGTW